MKVDSLLLYTACDVWKHPTAFHRDKHGDVNGLCFKEDLKEGVKKILQEDKSKETEGVITSGVVEGEAVTSNRLEPEEQRTYTEMTKITGYRAREHSGFKIQARLVLKIRT